MKNFKRLGGFLTGETNRFLRNAENKARKLAGKPAKIATYRRSYDEVVGGKPEAETPQLKTRKGYRVGKVPKVGEPVITRWEETSHTRSNIMHPAAFSNLEYLYGHTYRNTDTKKVKDIHEEAIRDVQAFVKTNPTGVARYFHGKRLQRLKKEDPDQYRTERAAVIGLGAGVVGWKMWGAAKRFSKELRNLDRGL